MPKTWAITVLFGLLWLVIAAGNIYCRSSAFIRRYRRSSSFIPLIGGLSAILAVFACPWNSPLKWGLFFLALLLDPGSLPYLTMLVMSLAFPSWLKAINKRRDERVRRILAAAQGSPVR